MDRFARIKLALTSLCLSLGLLTALGIYGTSGLSLPARSILFVSAAVSLVSASYLVFAVTMRLIGPIKRLILDAASHTTVGPSIRYEIRAEDPLAPIKDAFNRLNSALKEQRKEMRETLHSAPVAVIELERSGDIAFMNEEAGRLFWHPSLKGSPFTSLVHRDYRAMFNENVKEALSGYVSGKSVIEMVSLEGKASRFELTALPVRGREGVEGARLIMRSLDEVKDLKEELVKTRFEAEETNRRLKETISDLEEFALLAVRRELKMKEIRERFVELSKGKVEERGAEPIKAEGAGSAGNNG